MINNNSNITRPGFFFVSELRRNKLASFANAEEHSQLHPLTHCFNCDSGIWPGLKFHPFDLFIERRQLICQPVHAVSKDINNIVNPSFVGKENLAHTT